MPIPTYDQFIDPLVHDKPSPVLARKGRQNIAWVFNHRAFRHSKSSPIDNPIAGRADHTGSGVPETPVLTASSPSIGSASKRCTFKPNVGPIPSDGRMCRPSMAPLPGSGPAARGVFITTFTISQQAVEFVHSVERFVIIDGVRLTGLMIEHEVRIILRSDGG
jgi:hypothetical protein